MSIIQLKGDATERALEKLKVQKDNDVQTFKKTKVSVENGELICQGTKKKGKHGKFYRIPLSDILYVDTFSYGLFSFGVDVTYAGRNIWTLIGCKKSNAESIVALLRNNGVRNEESESIELKQSWLTNRILRMEGGRIAYRKYRFRRRMFDSANPEKVIYFDLGKSIFGGISIDFGSLSGGGEDNSVAIDHLTKKQVKEIRDLLIKHGSKLADVDNAIHYSSIFPLTHPLRWFCSREKLAFTDDGILHMQHTFSKSRSSFLPYETIKVVSVQGTILKQIFLQGATTISTRENFSPGTWSTVKKKLEEHQVKTESVSKFRPSFFTKPRWTSKKCLMVSGDGVAFQDKKTTSYLRFDQIVTLERHKEHWYSFYGDVEIAGERHDARKGEGGDVDMLLPSVGMFKWKKIKSAVKPNMK